MWDDTEEIIYFPTVWRRNGFGFRIEDLQEDRFDEVVELFKEHYIPNDIILKNTRILKEEESLQSFSDHLMYTLRNNSSLVAFDESIVVEESSKKPNIFEKPLKRKIAAVLVLRTMSKFNYGRVVGRTKLIQGDSMKKVVRLKEHMYKQIDFYAKYRCECILRVYYLCVKPEYRHQGLGFQLLLCAVDVARAHGASVVVGLFQTVDLQSLATKVGMKAQYQVLLSEWKENNGDLVFGDCVTEKYVLMDLRVPPLPNFKRPLSPKLQE